MAEREMRYDAPAYRTVCFLCQSAAEKFLKAYLIARGWTLKKTHDIVELLELCSDYKGWFIFQENRVYGRLVQNPSP